MILLVDAGNSRIKWATYQDAGLGEHGVVDYQGAPLLEMLRNDWQRINPPVRIMVANVAGQGVAQQINAVAAQLWNMTPVYAMVETEFRGVVNAYEKAEQLGIDRWMAMIAAWIRYRAPLCIVSCGTAITIDVISPAGQHAGGLILPGIDLMREILVNRVGGIGPGPGNIGINLQLGTSTYECIANGTGYAIVALIERVSMDMRVAYGEEPCRIITGGYAEQINDLLTHRFDFEPYLVLNGLAIVADHN